MTNDEACKWLANLRQDIGNPHYECLWGYEQAICEIISMLEEQEPVKPSVYVDTYVCPNCGHRLEVQGMLGDNVIVNELYNFCPVCGRKVKWDVIT